MIKYSERCIKAHREIERLSEELDKDLYPIECNGCSGYFEDGETIYVNHKNRKLYCPSCKENLFTTVVFMEEHKKLEEEEELVTKVIRKGFS